MQKCITLLSDYNAGEESQPYYLKHFISHKENKITLIAVKKNKSLKVRNIEFQHQKMCSAFDDWDVRHI